MRNPTQTRFLFAGLALAALLLATLLWLGSLRGAYTHFQPNVHQACGQPVSLRAEGYNLLGGTRYGSEPGDPGDDVELALVDFCDAVVQVLAHGEERLWFWFRVQSTGQVFPYYAWGIPEEDIRNPNANEWRHPVDPLWGYSAFTITRYATEDIYWDTRRGELCPLDRRDLPGINLFIDSEYGFRIPVGTTRAGWVCVRMGYGEPLPDSVLVSIRPQLARITRWVDRRFDIVLESPATVAGQPVTARRYQLPVLHTNQEMCDHALQTHPESITPGGGCRGSAE